MSCQISIFDIPHIIDGIGTYLAHHDLAACTLLNKTANEHFTRLLWRRLVFKPLSVVDLKTEPAFKKSLLDNLQFTRNLTIDTSNRSDILPLVTTSCTRLRQLTTLVSLSMSDNNDTSVSPVLSLVANNPSLLAWSLISEVVLPFNLMMQLPLVISKNPHLTVLELDFRLCPRRGWLKYALQCLPQSMNTITLQWKNCRRITEPCVVVEQDWPHTYPHMETADFSIELGVGEELALCQFLERCPALKTLKYSPVASTHVVNPIAELGSKLSNLTSLYLSWLNTITETRWRGLVMAMKGRIKSFATDAGFNTSSTKFVPDITTHWSDTLESLRFIRFSHMYSHDVQRILTTCSKLKILDCMWTLETEATQISDDGAEMKQWVCQSIEELHLMFADNRKPKVPEPEQTNQEIRTARRIEQIYQQLGRLVKLKELDIGWRTTNAFSECVNLDMSLESGLRHLEDLKALQTLDISSIREAKVGNDELQWMVKNWPQLREVSGLRYRYFHRNRRNSIPEYILSLTKERPDLIIH